MSEFFNETLAADDANSFWELFNKQCTGVQVGITGKLKSIIIICILSMQTVCTV